MRLRIYGLIAASWVFAAACAAGGVDNQTSDGGGGGSDTGTGGGTSDAGLTDAPPDVPDSCTTAAECAGLSDTCNVGVCENGVCKRTPGNEFGGCDDGLFCTENDVCSNGACVGGTQKPCPSLDECHIGACDEALDTCKNVAGNDGGQCDDGDPCTVTGVCQNGVCSKGGPIDCTVFDGPCTTGVCDPNIGCKSMAANEGGFCDDGQGSPCSAGACTAGQCISQSANEGGFCDDFQYCTINDVCQNGACIGEPNTCTAPGDVCMVGVCNEGLKTCTAVPGNNGGACDDGNDCTGGETCSNGTCQGGVPANQGQACDDKNGCTAGTTCDNGTCANATSTITQCIDGDQCCPNGCANDKDCLYWVAGVQVNVPQTALTGWTQCFSGTYDQNQPTMSTLLQQCNKAKLLMACRPTGQQSYTLLAMGPRLDVLFDCGTQTNCTKQSNGVGFYWSDQYSWGFAPGGLPVNRNSCDYNDGSQVSPALRLCWHTGGGSINSGYRCGDNDLNGAFNWERVVYHAD